MIKGLLVQENNVGIAPFMFGMAGSTPGRLNFFDASMKSLGLPNVAANVLMARHTELFLLGLLERLMALAAGVFELRMALDNRAWHDQAFPLLGGRRERAMHQHGHDDPSKKSQDPFSGYLAEPVRASLSMHNLGPSFPWAQYMWTAMMWTTVAMRSMKNSGICNICHRAKRRSYSVNWTVFRTLER